MPARCQAGEGNDQNEVKRDRASGPSSFCGSLSLDAGQEEKYRVVISILVC